MRQPLLFFYDKKRVLDALFKSSRVTALAAKLFDGSMRGEAVKNTLGAFGGKYVFYVFIKYIPKRKLAVVVKTAWYHRSVT